jgi:signal transduction histidine kinase
MIASLAVRIFCLGTCGWLGATDLSAATERPPPEARGFPEIRSFSPREYQGHNQIWTAQQGRDGVMYFGAMNNVIAFDGITWRSVSVPGAAFVRGMDIDDQGTIWVGGVNELGRIQPNDTGELVFESLRDRLPKEVTTLGDIRTVHAMPDGVYFQSDLYLLRWAPAGPFDLWEINDKNIAFAAKWQDRLIVSMTRGWLMPANPGEWERFSGEPDPATFTFLMGITPRRSGGWWGTAAERGLVHFDEDSTEDASGPVAEYLKASRLFGVGTLPDGRMLFGTLGNGILVTDADLNPLVHLSAENGLPSDTVICITPTAEGVVWVGTEQGIARIDLSPGFDRFTAAFGLESEGANTIARIEGRPHFATTDGPVVLVDGEGVATNPTLQPAFEINDKLNTFHLLPHGEVLVGGLRRMWWVDTDGSITPLHSPSNISAIAVHPKFPDHVFALHLTGISIWRRDGSEWSRHRKLAGPIGEFQSMMIDDHGDLWFGSSNAGVGRLPYSEVPAGTDLLTSPDPIPIIYTEADGLPPAANRFNVQEIDGAPLILSPFGLYRYDRANDRFEPETRYGERFTNGEWAAHFAAPSPHGGVWFRAKAARPGPDDRFAQIGKVIDGNWHPLPVPNLETIGALDDLICEVVDGDEILWLSGRAGVIRINVTESRAAPPAAVGRTVLLEINTAAGDRLPVATDTPIEIPARQNSLRFHFGSPGLAGELDAEHRSRLIGFVDGQFVTSNTGERTFTNLPPGTYTFEASGRTADHRWTEPARITFAVLAPWWLTPWAKFIYVVLVAIGVYLIVRWRTLRLERQRSALEKIIAERTAELAQKAEALERLHQLEKDETLAARLAAETARLELLRYQLNPHFLFNSLNSIRALVFSAPESAGEMVSKLADFCRRTLSRGHDEIVQVADELEMARNYLEIEQVRWQEGLRIELDIAEESLHCELPQNLLLPLLENAIKYGGRTSPDVLRVSIQTRLDGNTLTCAISNTGRWVKPDTNPFTDSTQIGLQNLRQRLRRHYGDAAAMEHDASVAGWVTIRINLPCQPPPSPCP